MVSMFIVIGVLATAFAAALAFAAVSDRRRSIEVDSDPTRFAPPALHPTLPWAVSPLGGPAPLG